MSNRKIKLIVQIFLVTILFAVVFFESKASSQLEMSLVPNELGQVMVLMYHEVGKREAEWTRSAKNFRNDLKILHIKGYRPISLVDYVNNQITTPKGLSPVIITFDDGTKGQFRIDVVNNKKNIASDSAVGILEEFHKTHPDFPLEATFFLNGKRPFRQPELVDYKLNYLIKRGFDIGNHTTKHQNLSSKEMQDPKRIQMAVGKQSAFLESKLKDHPNYRVNTLALCFGARPKTKLLAPYLTKGTAQGKPYKNLAILNVGGGPAYAPFDKRFNPEAIPRIRASDTVVGTMGFQDWIAHFDKKPEDRFVSDGDENTISLRKADQTYLNSKYLGVKHIKVTNK